MSGKTPTKFLAQLENISLLDFWNN